jgi:hypothetical protein
VSASELPLSIGVRGPRARAAWRDFRETAVAPASCGSGEGAPTGARAPSAVTRQRIGARATDAVRPRPTSYIGPSGAARSLRHIPGGPRPVYPVLVKCIEKAGLPGSGFSGGIGAWLSQRRLPQDKNPNNCTSEDQKLAAGGRIPQSREPKRKSRPERDSSCFVCETLPFPRSSP